MKYKHGLEISDGHYIELIDRIHVVICNIDEHILNNSVTCADPDIQARILGAIEILMDAYKKASSALFSGDMFWYYSYFRVVHRGYLPGIYEN